MCTVVLLHAPGTAQPLFLAANRDERLDRGWDPPAAWWPDRPGVVGGRDRTAGGTWMAVGPTGVVAAVLNRPGSLGPAAGLRSRGELPLLAAAAADAGTGAALIAALPAAEWRPFNMVIVDRAAAFFVRGTGAGQAAVLRLDPGVTMVTALDPNDLASPRTARHLPRFRAAAAPDSDDGAAWAALLADDSVAVSVADTLRVPPTDGFGTVSSSLLALDAAGLWHWRFAATVRGVPPAYTAVR